MEESIIFNNPLLLVGYGIALIFCVWGIKERIWGYVFPILSACFCVLTTTYALLLGASLYEVGTVVLVFLLLNLSVYAKNGEGK
ncbi:MAG: hypothetical protein IJW96_01870 [Clostridia bacterium]|nr:hypothetical protein [Clostridia bacterium]